MSNGRYNIAGGLFALGLFMGYGFLLIYLRDFHPDKAQWIASYGHGKHFEARMAHVHGNLLAVLNILIGFVLLKLEGAETLRKIASYAGLVGLLMPLGILAEVYLNTSPVPVLIGAASMVCSVVFSGWLALRYWPKNLRASEQ